MAEDRIAFDLVSPERLLLSGNADMVTLPGADGYFAVMAGHMPLISTLRPGVIDVRTNSIDERYFVLGGFAEVSPEKVTILAEEALPMSDVDAAQIDQRIKDTEEDLIAAKTDEERHRVAESLDHLKLLRSAL